jgi:Uri superfamily endonuclease
MKTSNNTNLTKGTYILILYLNTPETIEIGKLGSNPFKPGFYVYVGSTFGPGGLNSRLKHYVSHAKNPHWHIDYFRKHATITGIRVDQSVRKLEHQWAAGLKGYPLAANLNVVSEPVPANARATYSISRKSLIWMALGMV